MKKLILMSFCVLFVTGTALAAPSFRITSPPVINNGWTGPMIDPSASQGQWFMRIPGGEEEVRTHEFYDNSVEWGCGGGFADTLAIEGIATNPQYNAGGNLISFDVDVTITNDTPGEGLWTDGSNSHYESLNTLEQYEGTLCDTKLTVEFAIDRASYDNWINLWGPMNSPYNDIFPHIVAVEPDQLSWYCWTPDNPEELLPWGDYLVPTYDFGDIPQGQSATRTLSFTVDGGGLISVDFRRIAIESGQDIFINRTTSLKISTWMDMIAVDNGVGYPAEVGRSSDVSVFHNTPKPEEPKWLQLPDLSTTGIDIMATEPYILADDFECNEATLITEITVWGSWKFDELPPGGPNDVDFTLSIHEDIPDPSPPDPCSYSTPGEVLWYCTFGPDEFDVAIEKDYLDEGWWEPNDLHGYIQHGDTVCWRYTFNIPPVKAFCQQGTLDEPVIYWLDVQARPHAAYAEFGWKTSLDHWNDDAVWGRGFEPYLGPWWELRYPERHELHPNSIDLAFAIDGNQPCTPPSSDLGDAPDSTNNYGLQMTAYPGPGIVANFPTVYGTGSPPYGPIHLFPTIAYNLGAWLNGVSLENEADIGPDQDFQNNLDVTWDVPDLDGLDDGVTMPLYLPRCRLVTFDYRLSVVDDTKPIYVNVWFDWNRDGDWDDVMDCNGKPADEWAVQDQRFMPFAGMGQYIVTTPPFRTYDDIAITDIVDIWMRITLSATPWSGSGSGGSGPAGGYIYGETEDYYFTPDTSCWDCADFDLSGQINLYDLETFVGNWLWTGSSGGYNEADLDCDGDVQFDDFAILAGQWLSNCP